MRPLSASAAAASSLSIRRKSRDIARARRWVTATCLPRSFPLRIAKACTCSRASIRAARPRRCATSIPNGSRAIAQDAWSKSRAITSRAPTPAITMSGSLRSLREMLARYGVDGIWNNQGKFAAWDTGTCYCDTCRSLFRADSGHEIPLRRGLADRLRGSLSTNGATSASPRGSNTCIARSTQSKRTPYSSRPCS